jgi:hypothetical protein
MTKGARKDWNQEVEENLDFEDEPEEDKSNQLQKHKAARHSHKKAPKWKKGEKINILFLSANPLDLPLLKLDEEIRSITEVIRSAQYRDSLTLTSAWAIRPSDLLQALNTHQPQMVHFSGHGSAEGEMYLLDKDGHAMPVQVKAIRAVFKTLKDHIRVVFLNACSTRAIAEAITDYIDCVVGTNAAISDRAAILFSAAFYRAIGFGRSVQEAVDQGKAALLLEGVEEDELVEVFARAGVNPGGVVLVAPDESETIEPVQLARIKRGKTETIQILVFVQSKRKTYGASVPIDANVGSFIDDFVHQLGLPVTLNRERIRYRLLDKEEYYLDNEESFRDQEIQDGDRFKLYIRMGAK